MRVRARSKTKSQELEEAKRRAIEVLKELRKALEKRYRDA